MTARAVVFCPRNEARTSSVFCYAVIFRYFFGVSLISMRLMDGAADARL